MSDLVVEIKGGIGNQLFQLSAGLHYLRSWKMNKLILDINYFDKDARHGGFALADLLDLSGIGITKGISSQRVELCLDSIPGRFEELQKPSLTYDILLRGYFQNKKYIEEPLVEMRERYSVKKLFASSVNDSKENATTLGVHLRRGDYLSHPHIGIVSISAVEKEVVCRLKQFKSSGIDKPIKLKFVSDDPDAVLFSKHKPLMSKQDESKVVQDISQFNYIADCDYLICANSSFSYWASILSSRVVGASIPEPWMVSGLVSTLDLKWPWMNTYS